MTKQECLQAIRITHHVNFEPTTDFFELNKFEQLDLVKEMYFIICYHGLNDELADNLEEWSWHDELHG